MEEPAAFESLDSFVESMSRAKCPVSAVFHHRRLVDPFTNRVVYDDGQGIMPDQVPCYGIWGHGSVCYNCVSARAVLSRKPVMKMEFDDRSAYVIAASPLMIGGQWLSLELIHNAVEPLLYMGHPDGQTRQVHEFIRELNDMAVRDHLTGLFNRRYIDEKLPVMLSAAQRAGCPVSFLLVDIDEFKTVNDTWGHQAGDQVLVGLALTLLGHIHMRTDWVARYGGEEFFICLNDADAVEAAASAERMRQAVAQDSHIWEGQIIGITASFGVLGVQPQDRLTADQVISRVDEKVYEAKLAGRNRVAR
jgi:two-component system, cell cycle response regulator